MLAIMAVQGTVSGLWKMVGIPTAHLYPDYVESQQTANMETTSVVNKVSGHWKQPHIHGLVQDCSISSALAMEILQSCTKPSTYMAKVGMAKDPLSLW